MDLSRDRMRIREAKVNLNLVLQILPAVYNFKPDIIIISAGFDAHRYVSAHCAVSCPGV